MRQIGLLIVFAVISQVVVAQTLNVSVQNQNKQPIAHANILVNNKNVGYVNVNGQITLDLSTYQAPYRIQASYIGYSTSTKTITALSTQDSLIFELSIRTS